MRIQEDLLAQTVSKLVFQVSLNTLSIDSKKQLHSASRPWN